MKIIRRYSQLFTHKCVLDLAKDFARINILLLNLQTLLTLWQEQSRDVNSAMESIYRWFNNGQSKEIYIGNVDLFKMWVLSISRLIDLRWFNLKVMVNKWEAYLLNLNLFVTVAQGTTTQASDGGIKVTLSLVIIFTVFFIYYAVCSDEYKLNIKGGTPRNPSLII